MILDLHAVFQLLHLNPFNLFGCQRYEVNLDQELDVQQNNDKVRSNLHPIQAIRVIEKTLHGIHNGHVSFVVIAGKVEDQQGNVPDDGHDTCDQRKNHSASLKVTEHKHDGQEVQIGCHEVEEVEETVLCGNCL
jgi:hypothetical protein